MHDGTHSVDGPPTRGSELDELLDAMVDAARRAGERPAIVETGGLLHRLFGTSKRTLPYAEFGRRIDALASNLRAAGMREGDRVLYAVRPGIESMTILPALLRLGAVVVAVDSAVSEVLFAERMRLVAPRWVVAESILYALSADSPLRGLFRRLGIDLPDLGAIDATHIRVGRKLPGVPEALDYDALLRTPTAVDAPSARPELDAERDALVVFTSGTTSAPKGVVHTARSLGAMCRAVTELCALAPGDVVYSGQTHQMLAALVSGAVSVVPARGVDPDRFLRDVDRYRVTHAYGVPYEFAELVRRLEVRDARLPAHLRSIVLASAPVRRGFLRRFRARCAETTDLWCAYAMTEMLPVALVESREKLAAGEDGDLVGHLVAGVEARVADDGELFLRGPGLYRGYLGQPRVVEHASGDLARIDDAGRIVLLGRKKEMLIRREHNIYPSLYEDSLSAIEGVHACAMVSVVTDDGTDERIVLAVEPAPGQQAGELRGRIERAMADGSCPIDRFAVPDAIVFGAIPHGGRSNKLDRPRLSALVAEGRFHAG